MWYFALALFHSGFISSSRTSSRPNHASRFELGVWFIHFPHISIILSDSQQISLFNRYIYIYIYIIYIYIYIYYIYNLCMRVFTWTFRTNRMQHKVSFEVEFNRFEFKVLLLLDWLPYITWRASLPYYVLPWGRIAGLIIFLKGISTFWDVNKLVQSLNSVLGAHFQRR